MVAAAEAGITPHAFYDLTLDEIMVAIEGYHERERQSLISRVNAVLRGLGAAFSKTRTDPYKGLHKETEQKTDPAQFAHATRGIFKAAPGVMPENPVAKRFREAREAAFWGEE